MDPNPTRNFLAPGFHFPTSDESPRRKLQRLEDYVAGLEAERRKIEAFKRELPLCLELLNDAMERFGEESRKCRASVECNLVEVKGLNSENGVEDMKNWMRSVQLWNHHESDSPDLELVSGEERGVKGSSDDELLMMQPVVAPAAVLDRQRAENVGLSNGKRLVDELKVQKKVLHVQMQVCRKQRRCWSRELHRQFLDALNQLGGSEVATPKQIRDVMRVEGLTNDEVKSHLQKYRLHVRKAPSLLSAASNGPTPSQEDLLSKVHSKSQSKSPQGPLDRSAGSGKCTASDNTGMEDDAEGESEGHSWRNPIVFRPCLPSF